MTAFYENVFSHFCNATNIRYKHHNNNLDLFYKSIKNRTKPSILSVNNKNPDFDNIPNYLGSHFIRDPRDLLVSGYRYHKWCKEPWANQPMSQELKNILNLEDLGIEVGNESYQQILLNTDEITGYKIEFRWRKNGLNQMKKWDYDNPLILEMKYEYIFGNEVEEFSKLYNHYELPPENYPFFKNCIEKFNFESLKKNNKTGSKKHAEIGVPQQWKNIMPVEAYNMFMDEYENLIEVLNYEMH
jgi:hypothetical protein